MASTRSARRKTQRRHAHQATTPAPRLDRDEIIGGQALDYYAAQARKLLRREARALGEANPQLNDHVARMWERVADEGTAFPPRPLPEGIEWGELDMCLKNALQCSVKYGFTYVEGVGYFAGFDKPSSPERPIPPGLFRHTWCIDKNGEVVDTTYGFLGPHGVYLGIPLDQLHPPTATAITPLMTHTRGTG